MAFRYPNQRGVGVREELRAFARGVGMVVVSAPLYTCAIVLIEPIRALAAPLAALQLGRIVAAVPAAIAGAPGAGADLRTAVVLLAGAIVAGSVLEPVLDALTYVHGQRFQQRISLKSAEAVTRLPGLAHFEDPAVRDRVHVANWAITTPQRILPSMTRAFGQVGALIGYAALAAAYAPWVPILIVAASVPEAVAEVVFIQAGHMARYSESQSSRKANYFTGLGYGLAEAKESRIFGLKGFILGRRDEHWLQSMNAFWSVQRRSTLLTGLLGALAMAAAGVSYLAVLRDTVAGAVDPGTFVTTAAAVVALASGIPDLLLTFAFVRRDSFFLPDAFHVIDMPRRDPRLVMTSSPVNPAGPPSGIRFENVRFAYPGTERMVLDGVDLDIPAGSSVAVVGPNGEGKTTLIKLLCRFYDPVQGRILLDGVDLRDWDLSALRGRLAVIFQDFGRYALTARDNIAFGAPSRIHDDQLVRTAAARVGVLERLEDLPQKLDTPLSRTFDGVDLSGGEWQRVALARAVAAQLGGADLLVLDEPTANLDVRLEHDIYERFLEIRQGCTTILISHRFSTVRMAERIVLLSGGRVAEDGTHEQLASMGGAYADMYALQARHYRETGILE